MAGFVVEGYDVGELLGSGVFGEVWSGRDRVSGRPVALRRMPVVDAGRRDQMFAGASVLVSVVHPHLVRVHRAVTTDDAVVLALDHVGGGSLARLLERRGRRSAGEVVTLLVPLAQALVVLHGHGLVHGRVTPSAVLLGEDGRPLLSEAGLARLVGASQPLPPGLGDPAASDGALGGPDSDVHDLAASCWVSLVGHAPYDAAGARLGPGGLDAAARRVVDALDTALVADRGRRPSVEVLAARVFAAARAVPLQLGRRGASGPVAASPIEAAVPAPGVVAPPGVATPPEMAALDVAPHIVPAARRASSQSAVPDRGVARTHRVSGQPRPGIGWRGYAVALLGVAALAMAALSGLVWAGADSGAPAADLRQEGRRLAVKASPQASQPGPAAGKPSRAEPAARVAVASSGRGWVSVLERLDTRRAAAFAAADVDRLRNVYAQGSPAFARDQARLADLVAAGMRARGLRLRATGVSARHVQQSRVVLRVVDRMAPYELRDIGGVLVEQRAGRGARGWTVTLLREKGGWRIYDVASL